MQIGTKERPMLISNLEKSNNDFSHIGEDKHIASVFKDIETNFYKYFQTMGNDTASYAEQLESVFSVKISATSRNKQQVNGVKNLFVDAIAEFDKEKVKYCNFFNYESLEEFFDDQNSFKPSLRRECPIINRCVNSRRSEMFNWQYLFTETASSDLLNIFYNLIGFADEYKQNCDLKEYASFNSLEDFNFNYVQGEECTISGVISMGINSNILYYTSPGLFPIRSRRDLYGLYFLSDCKPYDLPSKSSEFLMIDDKIKSNQHNIKMEYNYFYPYNIYALYSLRIYRLIQQKCSQLGIDVIDKYRYVYVHTFLNHVCSQHIKQIKTMLGNDEDNTYF